MIERYPFLRRYFSYLPLRRRYWFHVFDAVGLGLMCAKKMSGETRALQEHRNQGRNGEYEAFAVGILALLQRYRHVYTTQDTDPQEQG
jgi:hypothetical protein